MILNIDPVSSLQAATKQYVDGYTGKLIKSTSFRYGSAQISLSDVDKSKANFLIISITGATEASYHYGVYVDDVYLFSFTAMSAKQRYCGLMPYADSIFVLDSTGNKSNVIEGNIRNIKTIKLNAAIHA